MWAQHTAPSSFRPFSGNDIHPSRLNPVVPSLWDSRFCCVTYPGLKSLATLGRPLRLAQGRLYGTAVALVPAAVVGEVCHELSEPLFQRRQPLALGDPFFVAGVEVLRAGILAEEFQGQRAVGLQKTVQLVAMHVLSSP